MPKPLKKLVLDERNQFDRILQNSRGMPQSCQGEIDKDKSGIEYVALVQKKSLPGSFRREERKVVL